MAGFLSKRRPKKRPTSPVDTACDSGDKPEARKLPEGSSKHPDGVTTFGERREAELSTEEKMIQEIRRGIEGDVKLRGRPALRGVIWQLSTSKLKNVDGTIVKGPKGEDLPMTMAELLIHTMVMRAISPGPDQRQWHNDAMTLLVGPALRRPEVLETPNGHGSGSNGGDFNGDGDNEPEKTPEQMAHEYERWQRLAARVIESTAAQNDRELNAIDVKAELVAENRKGQKPDGSPDTPQEEQDSDGNKGDE